LFTLCLFRPCVLARPLFFHFIRSERSLLSQPYQSDSFFSKTFVFFSHAVVRAYKAVSMLPYEGVLDILVFVVADNRDRAVQCCQNQPTPCTGMRHIEDDLALKYPGMARDSKVTPTKACRLMCLACVGDVFKDVENCTNTKCFLYPHRLGIRPETARKRGYNVDRKEPLQEKSEGDTIVSSQKA